MLELCHPNSANFKDNLDSIDNNLLDVNQLKDQISHSEEMKKLRSELKHTWNRGLGKTIIFRTFDSHNNNNTKNHGMKVNEFLSNK